MNRYLKVQFMYGSIDIIHENQYKHLTLEKLYKNLKSWNKVVKVEIIIKGLQ